MVQTFFILKKLLNLQLPDEWTNDFQILWIFTQNSLNP